jgi:ABC-type glycerol-3-phosphate transport system substrate-binding protein
MQFIIAFFNRMAHVRTSPTSCQGSSNVASPLLWSALVIIKLLRATESRSKYAIRFKVALLLALVLGACSRAEANDTTERTVIYWEKWTDFEGEAADRLVAAFNERERAKAKQQPGYRPIQVKKVTISRIDQKLLVAIAGGNPPDVAGTFSRLMPAYADKGALVDLTNLLKSAGITRDKFIPVYWDMTEYKGRVWAALTTPASLGLHWNKRLLAEAGLDTEQGPRTIEELDAWAEKLTKWEVTLQNGQKEIQTGYLPNVPASQKRLVQAGFLPNEPGWWNYAWGYFFGGELLEGDRITATHPDNIRAYEWVASYSKKLGVDAIQRFRSGFGNFASPQNPFLSGRVAMVLQGVWMYNFIEKFSPGMQWSAAPFPYPANRPDLKVKSLVEADILVIPKGARRPEEAFEFIKFATSQEGMEMLCKGQRKFSPLMEVSQEFYADHPHPLIYMFRNQTLTKNAFFPPMTGIWNEYQRELVAANDLITNLSATPRAALTDLQERLQESLDRDLRILKRRAANDSK